MSVRNSMYRMVFTLIVFPFLLFSLLIIYIYSGRLEKIITESLRVVANSQVAEMTNFCEQQKDYLALIGTMDISVAAMRGNLSEDMHQYLDDMLYSQVRAMDYMKSIAIINKDYRVVACSEEHDIFAGDGIQNVIDSMADQSFYITDVLEDKDKNKTLIAISRIEEGGELLGYGLAELNLDFYKEIREEAELWNESTFYLLDGKQQIISAGTSAENRETFVTSANERSDYLKKFNAIDYEKDPQGSFMYKVGGKNYITYYSDVKYTDWRVMLSVKMSNYEAQKTVYFVLAFFMILLCAVLAVWIGGFASRRIVQPIKHISDTLRAIQKKQDYSLRVAVERRDELGSLSGEVNELIDFIETENLYKTQQQRLLQEKAGKDALTKVLNKERILQALQDTIESCSADKGTMAVLFTDIDNFKAFNDNYGHSVGDQVLLFVASILGQETGGTVGRMGGDEFLVIVDQPERVRELDQCLKKLQEIAGSRFIARGTGTHLPISCCIGAVQVDFGQSGLAVPTPEQLIDMADTAMYQIKNNGKGGHVIKTYDPMSELKV